MNGSTTIRFEMVEAGLATVEVFDIRGRRVASLFEGRLAPGEHSTLWNGTSDSGTSLPNGIYLVGVWFNGERTTRQISLIR